jgi:hypothetical protein
MQLGSAISTEVSSTARCRVPVDVSVSDTGLTELESFADDNKPR